MRIQLKDGALYRYCVENGISRDELARRMGVASTTAYRVEKGDVEPSPKFIAALLLTTNKSFEDMFEIVKEPAA
ncbi:MAG TPA: helix-turn-helix transcriptional regulator [Nocardioidaceae bacterium]|jgi:transcriptional regulator with XRE-family HTH domain